MQRVTTAAITGLLMLVTLAVATAARVGAQAVPTCDGIDATAFLTSPGTLIGTSGDDVLVGSPGADVIKGLGGNDLICGEVDLADEGGDDLINGGSGNDHIHGNVGNDTVKGDAGNDELRGDDDGDVLRGGSGDDELGDSLGNNDADGGQGRDMVRVAGTARGGSGDDTSVFAFNDDFLPTAGCFCTPAAYGDSGSDTITAVSGANGIADGGSGNDLEVSGDHGAADLRGGSANDYLLAADDDLILNGGSGYDSCDANGHAGITFISCEVIA